MEVSINGGTPMTLDRYGKSHEKMDDDWGYSPILGHLHILTYPGWWFEPL